MALICKPNIKVDNIVFEKDKDDETGTKKILGEWGRRMPIIKIGEYVLSIGELKFIELSVALNCLPYFTMEIDDTNYAIRESLKADIDKCTIFIGYETWYVKFTGLITNIDSDAGDAVISLKGILFNDKLYETIQKSYKDKTVGDILKDIAEKTKMGLFTFENAGLTQQLDYCINPNNRYFDFLKSVIKNYTTNVWCVDFFYFIHVGDIENMQNKPIDKFTFNQNGEQETEKDICFTSKGGSDYDEELDAGKIKIAYYALNSNIGETHLRTYKTYKVNQTELASNNDMGISGKTTNTFSGFESHKKPYNVDIINKDIGGTSIKIISENPIFELVPFTNVNFECYLPSYEDKPLRLDEEHSGKKTVIGFKYEFLPTEDGAKLTQYIDLI